MIVRCVMFLLVSMHFGLYIIVVDDLYCAVIVVGWLCCYVCVMCVLYFPDTVGSVLIMLCVLLMVCIVLVLSYCSLLCCC